MNKYFKIFKALVLFLFLSTNIVFAQEKLTSAGCTTEFFLIQSLAIKYKEMTGVRIMPVSTGNKKAILKYNEGLLSFVFSCQPLTTLARKIPLTDEQISNWKCVEIAKDPIVIIINKAANVNKLTLEQINDIFSGKTKNWSEIGGAVLPIKIGYLNPKLASGVVTVFKESTIGGKSEIKGDIKTFDNPSKLNSFCSNTEGAISFLSKLNYMEGKFDLVTINGIAPEVENILTNKYPLLANYHIIYDETNTQVKEFVDFIFQDEGQKIINKKMISVKG